MSAFSEIGCNQSASGHGPVTVHLFVGTSRVQIIENVVESPAGSARFPYTFTDLDPNTAYDFRVFNNTGRFLGNGRFLTDANGDDADASVKNAVREALARGGPVESE